MLTTSLPAIAQRRPLVTLGCAIAGLIAVALGCGWRQRDAAREPPRCAPLAARSAPRTLVLRVDRFILPIGGPSIHEAAQLTAGGACAPDAPCRRVSTETLERVYQLVRATAGALHRAVYVSPHYGARSITAALGEDRCAIADGSQEPLAEADLPAFDAAFDAVASAFLADGAPTGN